MSHINRVIGILAAESIYPILTKDQSSSTVASSGEISADWNAETEVTEYETQIHKSWIADELKIVRNTHVPFHYGMLAGMIYTAFSCFVSKGKEPWTFYNHTPDSEFTKPAANFKEIEYPKNDGKLTFDLLVNLQRSGTAHEHDQPAHLRVKETLKDIPSSQLLLSILTVLLSLIC